MDVIPAGNCVHFFTVKNLETVEGKFSYEIGLKCFNLESAKFEETKTPVRVELKERLRGIKAILPHKAPVDLGQLYVLFWMEGSYSVRKLLNDDGQLMIATD